MVKDRMDIVNEYLKVTGQSRQYLLSGGATFGLGFIMDELVPQALKEKKKIIWKADLMDGEDVGLVTYKLKGL